MARGFKQQPDGLVDDGSGRERRSRGWKQEERGRQERARISRSAGARQHAAVERGGEAAGLGGWWGWGEEAAVRKVYVPRSTDSQHRRRGATTGNPARARHPQEAQLSLDVVCLRTYHSGRHGPDAEPALL